jgi:integrase/recombinase XerD
MHRSHSWLLEQDPQGLIYLTARYLERLRVKNYSELTLGSMLKSARNFWGFCEALGITQARQVTRSVILNYQSYLFHYRKNDGQALAIGTQKHRLTDVSAFFSYLTREGHVAYNPASDLELPRKEYRLPKVILSAQEMESLLNVPDVKTPLGIRDRSMLETFYSTGMRRLELVRLNKQHIDFERQLVQIEQGKGKKDRFVPIGDRALAWVEKYLVEVRPMLCPSINEPALFINQEGRRINPTRLGVRVHEIFKQANLGKTGGCHIFRHTFATVLLQNGCDLRHIQAMLGHASLETTQIYTHVAITELQQAHRKYHPARMPEES